MKKSSVDLLTTTYGCEEALDALILVDELPVQVLVDLVEPAGARHCLFCHFV